MQTAFLSLSCISFIIVSIDAFMRPLVSFKLRTMTLSAKASEDPLLQGSHRHSFQIQPHKPLGITIEESLTPLKHVFVSSVIEGSHAGQAGVQVGDVLIECNNLFGDLQNVQDLDIESIQGFVASRPAEEALQVVVLRGSGVYAAHERILVELCSNPEASDQDIDQCVVDFLKEGYFMDINDNVNAADSEEDENTNDDEDDAVSDDALIDNLYNMWAEVDELTPKKLQNDTSIEAEPEAPVKKPWSSRSSPSGTFVRDPATGKMVNIDQ